MDQTHWLKLSDTRLAEARALLTLGFWSGAYYLAGYAVECRLKAVLVGLVQRDPGIVFREPRFQADVWTHDFARLLKRAGLEDQRRRDCQLDFDLNLAWSTVMDWTESIRYGFANQADAEQIIAAVDNPTHGVIAWIKNLP